VQSYDIFAPAEVEREPTTQQIIARVDMLKPQRVFLDAMTQFRYLASDAFQFRKQALSFLRFLIEQGATVLFTSEGTSEAPDDDLQFMADGVIHLDFAAEAHPRCQQVPGLRLPQRTARDEVERDRRRSLPRLLPRAISRSLS
jgi:circadian clock protein KaiC